MKIEIDKPVVPQWFDDWYKTFKGNKTNALYFLNRIGWGHGLVDYNDKEVKSYPIKLFNIIEAYDNYDSVKEYLSKAILYGYEVEQKPLYYAKIKGWELTRDKQADMYWMVDKQDNKLLVDSSPVIIIDRLGGECGCVTKFTREDWNKLGINDTNADFERVE